MSARIYGLALCAATMAVILGCGPSTAGRERTFPVTGKVTMGGAPVIGATVTFTPLTADVLPAYGRTDDQGMYTLTTYDSGDGAVPGGYKVLVSKAAPGGGGGAGGAPAHDPTGASGVSGAPQHSGGAGGGGGAASSGGLLPDQYASKDTTPLQKTVSEGDNEINIEL